MKAVWNGRTVAESDAVRVVEGNRYFPPDSLRREFLTASEKTTVCPWKGTAEYFDVTVDGETNPAAAWFYADPKPEAAEIRDHVAFWKGVEVTD